MTVERHATIDDVESEWDALCDRVGAPPWHRAVWYQAWWASFGRGILEIVTARRQGRLVGLVPLERHGREIRAAANSESPDFTVIAEDSSAAEEVARAIFATGRRVNLFPLPSGTPSSRAIYDVAVEAGYSLLDRSLGGAPYVTITDWDDYLSTVDSKMLREIHRRERRLREMGMVTLEISTAAREGDIEEFFELEARSWKGDSGTAIVSSRDTEAFYRRLRDLAAQRGWLVLAFLRLGVTAIAADIGLEVGRSHYLLKTSFDARYARYGPGQLLHYLMLRRAFGANLATYDFLGRDDSWKKNWTKTIRPLTHLRAFPPSPLGTAERAYFRAARSMKRRLQGKR